VVSVYVSKMHSVIYKDASVGILLVEDGVLKKARQMQRFNINASDLDVDVLYEVSMLTKDVDFFVMYMKTKMPDDFDRFVKRTSSTNKTKRGKMLADAWSSMKGNIVWERGTPTRREDRAWMTIASKLSKFTKEGMVGDMALKYFVENYSKSFKSMYSGMSYLRDLEADTEIERKARITEMKKKNMIFVISRETNNGTEPVFATYDEKVANGFMDIMFDYFSKRRNAKKIFAMVVEKSGVSRLNADRLVPTDVLAGFGLNMDSWRELCRNTFNGESDKFYINKLPIK
jgi:hypothetical protein